MAGIRYPSGALILLLVSCATGFHINEVESTDVEPEQVLLNETIHDDLELELSHELDDNLFEGDIMLTPEQEQEMKERKAINDSSGKWPADSSGTVTIGYRFGDTRISQSGVMKAINHWQQHTCLKYKLVGASYRGPHLKFVDARGCSSYVGRISSMTSGQLVRLSKGCIKGFGSAVHEIGHAMGFNHEQSRSDRDTYVKILTQNIRAGRMRNFRKARTNNYDVKYDYFSVMHYGTRGFSTNGKDTILAINPLGQPLMGNRKIGLTFRDKKLANTLYSCINTWLKKCNKSTEPCQNGGYTGKDCKCVCPDGTSGSKCQVITRNYTDAILQKNFPATETITKQGVVSTPGYPTPIQTRLKMVKVLLAPKCFKVKLVITDFHLYRRRRSCNIDSMDIRTLDAVDTGKIYCGTEIKKSTTFTSESNRIILWYQNYDYKSANYKSPFRGFKGIVTHVPIPGCVPPTPKPTTSPEPIPTTTPNPIATTTPNPIATTTPNPIPTTTPNPIATTTPNPIATTSQNPLITTTGNPLASTTRKPTSGPSLLSSCRKSSDRPYGVVLNTCSQLDAGGSQRMSKADRVTLLRSGRNWDENSPPAFGPSDAFFQDGSEDLVDTEPASDCSKNIELKAQSTGKLSVTDSEGYVRGTVLEWRIQAPTGSRVQLKFRNFDVGDANCTNDYLVVDTSGDSEYQSASRQFCGTNSPGTITSTGTQLNVLLNGREAGFPGFAAEYRVVDAAMS